MRIAIPVTGTKDDSALSMKFARSEYFVIYDRRTRTYETLKNPFAHQKVKAGKQLFDLLTLDRKVDAFLAIELGLKVQQMAVKNKIQLIIMNEKQKMLQEVLGLFNPAERSNEN